MHAAAAFLGSFLLFTLELAAGKALLPRFGGAAHVWTGSMMVYQGLLLAGYLYARWAARLRRYALAHLALLALPVFWLPLSVSVPDSGAPGWQLLRGLLGAVGVPFFVLATTSTVLQAWRRRVHPGDEAGNYALYAASNAGSLCGLLAYPLILEPLLPARALGVGWMILYAVFAALHAPLLPPRGEPQPAPPASSRAELACWILLSLGPSAALLAATSLLTLDFAAVPLLWVLPLVVYLGTLILSFKKVPWYPKRLSVALAVIMALWAVTVLITLAFSSGLPDGFSVMRRLWVVNKFMYVCAGLFVLCLICHRALSLSRPPAERAPTYYAAMSLGGWLGGLLVAVILPVVGRRLAMPELDWATAGFLCVGALLARDAWLPNARDGDAPPPGRLTLAVLALLGAGGIVFYARQSPAFAPGTVAALRNFYGYYRVVDSGPWRRFFHGNTMHGLQHRDPALPLEPQLYYSRASPIGDVYSVLKPRRSAVVGLGVGVLAAYGEKGQVFDFYELDPDVEALARAHFRYLAETKAEARVILGDARLELAKTASRYDLIALDAFTGGSIPVHTLTREAFAAYKSKLADGGIIAAHVTNRFLNLNPALAAQARVLGWSVVGRQGDVADKKGERVLSDWVVLTSDAAKAKALLARGWKDLSTEPAVRPWTDDFASLLSALRR